MPTFGRNPSNVLGNKPSTKKPVNALGNTPGSARMGNFGKSTPKNPLVPRSPARPSQPNSRGIGTAATTSNVRLAGAFDDLEPGERHKVKKSGIYKLAKGEEVKGKSRAESALSKVTKKAKSRTAKGGKGKGHKGKIRSIRLEKTSNGKFLAHHQFEPDANGVTEPDQTHALNDMDELHDHLDDHLSGPEEPEEPQGAPSQPAPMSSMGG